MPNVLSPRDLVFRPDIMDETVKHHPWEGGTKVYINGIGHMTKMAAMPLYGKNL